MLIPLVASLAILVASLSNPALVPARMMHASVPTDKYPSLATVPPEGFAEMGVFRTVSEVGDPGNPNAGGVWMVGHSKTDTDNTAPATLRGTWIGPQGAPLVFNQILRTAQGVNDRPHGSTRDRPSRSTSRAESGDVVRRVT